jgi:hypothetical protein
MRRIVALQVPPSTDPPHLQPFLERHGAKALFSRYVGTVTACAGSLNADRELCAA